MQKSASILDGDDAAQRTRQAAGAGAAQRVTIIDHVPDRVVHFLRQQQQALKFMSKEEVQQLKQQFLELEQKEVRKVMVELHKRQEQRKRLFMSQLKQFEADYFKSQADQRRQEQLRTMQTVQEFDEKTKAIRDNTRLTEQQKLRELEALKRQVEQLLRDCTGN